MLNKVGPTRPIRYERVKILQWKCRSISNKIDNLKTIADNYDVILLSETWLTNKKKLQIKNFNIVRKDRSLKGNNNKDHGGGVCILIKFNLIFEEYKQICNKPDHLESVAITLLLENEEKILIGYIYS